MTKPSDRRADYFQLLWKHREHWLPERAALEPAEDWMVPFLRRLGARRVLDAHAEWGVRVAMLHGAGFPVSGAMDDLGQAFALGAWMRESGIPGEMRFARWRELATEFAGAEPFDAILYSGFHELPGRELLQEVAASTRALLAPNGSVIFSVRWHGYDTDDQKSEPARAAARLGVRETMWGAARHRLEFKAGQFGVDEIHTVEEPGKPAAYGSVQRSLYYAWDDLRTAFKGAGFRSVLPLVLPGGRSGFWGIASDREPEGFLGGIKEALGLASVRA